MNLETLSEFRGDEHERLWVKKGRKRYEGKDT